VSTTNEGHTIKLRQACSSSSMRLEFKQLCSTTRSNPQPQCSPSANSDTNNRYPAVCAEHLYGLYGYSAAWSDLEP
jgi:hypothetical protein